MALEFVPERFKTTELCNQASNADWRAFAYVPASMITLDKCINILQVALTFFEEKPNNAYNDKALLRKIVRCFPEEINNEIVIIRLERQLGIRDFREKYYSITEKKFFTKEYISYRDYCEQNEEEENNSTIDNSIEIKEFGCFNDFYSHLDGDMNNANLYDYGFDGVDLKEYNIAGAYINSDVLIHQGLYDDSFYTTNVKEYISLTEQTYSLENEIVKAVSVLHEHDILPTYKLNDDTRRIYYISDIHLNHKILKAFPGHATEEEIMHYIKKLIDKMLATVCEKSYDDYLLVAGDVSFSFEISKMFYSILANKWSPKRIIAVLGNHELWDYNFTEEPIDHERSLDDIVQRYREFFAQFGIRFLQNDLFIKGDIRGDIIISAEQLQNASVDKLRKMGLKSSLIIFGGLGFSGLNPNYNANNGIYRDKITTLEEDRNQSKRFEEIYSIVEESLGKSKVIILTHMPKENWSAKAYNKNWIYVNGHTHRNEYYSDTEKTVYSDNQVGYYSINLGLKYFYASKHYDLFASYSDGIYEIFRNEYIDFNRGVGIFGEYNRLGKIFMIKRSNIYCFFYEDEKTQKMYLLNGGIIVNIPEQNLQYYYENMEKYSQRVEEIFSGYFHALKRISDVVKAFGGRGSIHGCIVDIDFFNHLYLNPLDGTITPYCASSVVDKYIYNGIDELLIEQRKDLYENYKRLLSNNSERTMMINGKEKSTSMVLIPQCITDTSMYKPSRVIRSLQYLTEANVIRTWNDALLDTTSPPKSLQAPLV